MNEAIIILMNMRGGCATIGNTVHTLFRVNGRSCKADPDGSNGASKSSAVSETASECG